MAYNAKVADVEEETNFKSDTIRRWCWIGYIPHVKVGRGTRKSLRFDLDEIREWMKQGRQAGRTTHTPEIDI